MNELERFNQGKRSNMRRCHAEGHYHFEAGMRYADGRFEGRCGICGAYRYVSWDGYEWRTPRGVLLGYASK